MNPSLIRTVVFDRPLAQGVVEIGPHVGRNRFGRRRHCIGSGKTIQRVIEPAGLAEDDASCPRDVETEAAQERRGAVGAGDVGDILCTQHRCEMVGVEQLQVSGVRVREREAVDADVRRLPSGEIQVSA